MMGRLTVNGLDGIIDDLAELAKLPDNVITDILNAEADVIVQAQRTEIESRWKGPHSLGISAKSVKKARSKKDKTGGILLYTRRGAADAAGVPHATRKSRLSTSTGRTGGTSPPARP